MKRTVTILLLLLGFIAWAKANTSDDAIQAYNNAVQAYDNAVQQLQRSNLRSQKKELVKKALSLTAEQAQAFWPIYNQYEADTIKLNDGRIALIQEYLSQRKDLSSEKATELINRVMQAQEQRHEMKKAYVKDLGKVLTAKQALRLLLLENQIDVQLEAQIAAQIPL